MDGGGDVSGVRLGVEGTAAEAGIAGERGGMWGGGGVGRVSVVTTGGRGQEGLGGGDGCDGVRVRGGGSEDTACSACRRGPGVVAGVLVD